jgi:hypothetical protein
MYIKVKVEYKAMNKYKAMSNQSNNQSNQVINKERNTQ